MTHYYFSCQFDTVIVFNMIVGDSGICGYKKKLQGGEADSNACLIHSYELKKKGEL